MNYKMSKTYSHAEVMDLTMTDFCACVCCECDSSHGNNWIGCELCDEYLCHSCNKYTSKNAKKNYLDMVGEEHSGWDTEEEAP
tara:strand:+ start:145 stop:393 length:249 start_codon:yes stop_codon:yes gene_type:complete